MEAQQNPQQNGGPPDAASVTLERYNNSLSIVSHDLKSPMVAIIGCAKFLLKDMKNRPHDPKWLNMLERMVRAGGESLQMVEDILAMVKMEAGRENAEPEWVDNLATELRDIVRTFEFEAQAKNIRLGFDVRGPLPPVKWDIKRIRYHALNNIISNALKFTPAGGEVTLSAEEAGGAVLIRTADTGPGIAPADRERIFCRFEQAESKSRRVMKGAGLGLYNARLFVARHGGTIAVESSGGHGTVILIALPVDAGPFASLSHFSG